MAAPKKQQPRVDPWDEALDAMGLIMAEDFATPEFKVAWLEWDAYRRKGRFCRSSLAIQGQMRRLATIGYDGAIAALEYTRDQGYKGIIVAPGTSQRDTDWRQKRAEGEYE